MSYRVEVLEVGEVLLIVPKRTAGNGSFLDEEHSLCPYLIRNIKDGVSLDDPVDVLNVRLGGELREL